MDIKEFNVKIGNLVGQDKLQEAIGLLHKLFKSSPLLNDVILQSSKLNDLQRQIRNGTISIENENVTKNKIRLAILSLSDQIETSVLENEILENEINLKDERELEKGIIQKHFGNGDNVAGNKIINQGK